MEPWFWLIVLALSPIWVFALILLLVSMLCIGVAAFLLLGAAWRGELK